MATIEVSTWSELVSAVTQPITEITTVKITKDIDCNEEIPQGVSSTVVIPQANRDIALTIDGGYEEGGVTKRHKIINLRTNIGSPVPIFRLNGSRDSNWYRTIWFKNIDFLNLQLDAALTEGDQGYQSSGGYPLSIGAFVNCRFMGKRTTNMFTKSSFNNAGYYYMFNNNFVNVPYYGTTKEGFPLVRRYPPSSSYKCQFMAQNCRFRCTYTGTYTPTYDSGKVYSDIYNANLNGCYIDGEIVGADSDTTYINIYTQGEAANDGNPSMQNVYDVNFYMKDVVSDRNIDFGAFKGVVKSPVKDWDDKTISCNSYNSKTGIIFASETDMQNAQWLYDHGLDIIVPNQGG